MRFSLQEKGIKGTYILSASLPCPLLSETDNIGHDIRDRANAGKKLRASALFQPPHVSPRLGPVFITLVLRQHFSPTVSSLVRPRVLRLVAVFSLTNARYTVRRHIFPPTIYHSSASSASNAAVIYRPRGFTLVPLINFSTN